MGSDKLTLNWRSFECNLSSSLAKFRENSDFYDVTLVCDDDQIQCHKIVLSACSPFFLYLLRRNPHPHPLLYLKGVAFKHLLSLLDFMYHGQVNVNQEDLASFMVVAADLKIKGLAPDVSKNEHEDVNSPVKMKRKNNKNNPEIPPSCLNRKVSPDSLDTDFVFSPVQMTQVISPSPSIPKLSPGQADPAIITDPSTIQSSVPIFSSKNPLPTPELGKFLSIANNIFSNNLNLATSLNLHQGDIKMKDNTTVVNKEGVDQVEALEKLEGVQLKEKCKSMMKKLEDGSHQCLRCGYTNKRKNKVRSHTELHIPCLRHVCDLCNRSFKNLNSLRSHKYIKHKEIKDQQDIQTLDKIKLEHKEVDKTEGMDNSEVRAVEITKIVSTIMNTKTSSGINPQVREAVPRIQEKWITTPHDGETGFGHSLKTYLVNGVEEVEVKERVASVNETDSVAEGVSHNPVKVALRDSKIEETDPVTEGDSHILEVSRKDSQVTKRDSCDSVKWDDLTGKDSRVGEMKTVIKLKENAVTEESSDSIDVVQGDPRECGEHSVSYGQEEKNNPYEETVSEFGDTKNVDMFDPMEF